MELIMSKGTGVSIPLCVERLHRCAKMGEYYNGPLKQIFTVVHAYTSDN